MEAFFKSERNYIILSNSGKPLFAAHGDIYTLSSVYATLYAMVQKVESFEFLEEESVNEMTAGESKKTIETPTSEEQ